MEEAKKKKLPWWVYLLQLLPATIDSIRLLVKEAKEKKKLKREAVIASEAKQSQIKENESEIASPQETVRNDDQPTIGPDTYNKN